MAKFSGKRNLSLSNIGEKQSTAKTHKIPDLPLNAIIDRNWRLNIISTGPPLA